MQAKLSIWSQYYHELSPEDAVKRFLDNGIFCSELSDEHGTELLSRDDNITKTGKAFSAFLAEHNFEMSQGHLWLRARICSEPDAVQKLYRWIDLYEAIGIKNMVLHCDELKNSGFSFEERIEKNVASLKILASYIDGRDITICLENLRGNLPEDPDLIDAGADDLLHIIDLVGSDQFGICLDTGHLNLTLKNQREFILKAGSRLKALHITDNEGRYDQHLMPYTRGVIKFPEVVRALREVNYHGLFNLEIPGETRIPIELRDAKIQYIKTCYDYLMEQ